MTETSFRILMVCSGNLCRSPIAEQLLRARTIGYPVRVSSAGLIADDGAPMPEEAARVSRRYGGKPEGHRSRLLTEALLREADLVLTATRGNRSSVVQLLPRVSRRTFTINEFVRLAGAVPESDRAALVDSTQLVSAVRSLRGFVAPPEDMCDDDLEDPYRRPFEVYESVGALIHEQIAFIADRLRPQWMHR